MAKIHSVTPAAVEVVLAALRSGGGRMVQFSHADFGGMSQWSPGMSMVGDMFNTQLKTKLDALCSDLATHLDSSETREAPPAGDDRLRRGRIPVCGLARFAFCILRRWIPAMSAAIKRGEETKQATRSEL